MVPYSWYLQNSYKKYVERVTSTSKKSNWKKNRRKNK